MFNLWGCSIYIQIQMKKYIIYFMILKIDRVPSLYRLISYCNLSQPTHRWLSLMRECSARHNESECLGGEQIGEFSTWETLKMMFWFTHSPCQPKGWLVVHGPVVFLGIFYIKGGSTLGLGIVNPLNLKHQPAMPLVDYIDYGESTSWDTFNFVLSKHGTSKSNKSKLGGMFKN